MDQVRDRQGRLRAGEEVLARVLVLQEATEGVERFVGEVDGELVGSEGCELVSEERRALEDGLMGGDGGLLVAGANDESHYG